MSHSEKMKIRDTKLKDGAHILLLERHIALLEKESKKLIGQFMLESPEELIIFKLDPKTILIESLGEESASFRITLMVMKDLFIWLKYNMTNLTVNLYTNI